jgi:L-fuconolactonase
MSDVSRRTFLGTTLAMTSLAAAGYRIIDSHVHTWKHDPEFPFALGANVPARDAAPETLLDLMKTNGVSKTVIIQVIHYRYDNRFLEHVLKQYPGTFKGVCRVDPLDPAAPDQLSQLTERGFNGVRLSPGAGASGDWIDGSPDAPALEALLRPESPHDGVGSRLGGCRS